MVARLKFFLVVITKPKICKPLKLTVTFSSWMFIFHHLSSNTAYTLQADISSITSPSPSCCSEYRSHSSFPTLWATVIFVSIILATATANNPIIKHHSSPPNSFLYSSTNPNCSYKNFLIERK